MEHAHDLAAVPDDELLRRLAELLRQSRRVEADLVSHISGVDRRRLYENAYLAEVDYGRSAMALRHRSREGVFGLKPSPSP